jgi:hypothetical protein
LFKSNEAMAGRNWFPPPLAARRAAIHGRDPPAINCLPALPAAFTPANQQTTFLNLFSVFKFSVASAPFGETFCLFLRLIQRA